MRKGLKIAMGVGTLSVALVGLLAMSGEAEAGRGDGGIVYVSGQGLFFDTFVTVDPLPPHGRFQKIEMGGPMGATGTTEYGPGDPGYLGGRWWADENGNGEMDPDDHYFLCPLLGPGRETP